MIRTSLLLILTCIFFNQILCKTNGTESYFFSPHGLGRTPEVDNALSNINGQVRVKRTSYNHSSITYVLDNVTIGMAYNDGKQKVQIPKKDVARISGGRIQFTYRFNYTKTQDRNVITGYGYGSVLSDPLVYLKTIGFCGGFLCWKLQGTGVDNLTLIENRMKIKRLEPFNQSDLENLEDMLDKAFTSIDPANFEVQILQIFNQIFPLSLSDSLNHEIFGEKIKYVYHSSTHGEIKMDISHQVFGFGIAPEEGYRVIFVTIIDNWDEPICDETTVPLNPDSFEIYGGSQNFHLNCLYESVVFYLQSNGWLDSVLNDNWETDSFQFYAGDLFDLINNLYLTFEPRAILDGSCAAQKSGLKFFSSRQFDANTYTLDVTYNCNLKGTNKEGSTTQILKFTAGVKIYIVAEASTKTLTFKITQAEMMNLSFQPVGNYFVNNLNLAMFKANSVLRKLANTYTFGTGFPTISRELPKTKVSRDYVLYYDSSHLEMPNIIDS